MPSKQTFHHVKETGNAGLAVARAMSVFEIMEKWMQPAGWNIPKGTTFTATYDFKKFLEKGPEYVAGTSNKHDQKYKDNQFIMIKPTGTGVRVERKKEKPVDLNESVGIRLGDLRDIIREQMGQPRFARRGFSSWEGWVREHDDDEADTEETEEMTVGDDSREAMGGYSSAPVMPESTKLSVNSLRNIILAEVQQMSDSPWQSQEHKESQVVPRPVIQGSVRADDAQGAREAFMSDFGVDSSAYSVSCEQSPPGSGTWSCIGNRTDKGNEQMLTYPNEEGPGLDEP